MFYEDGNAFSMVSRLQGYTCILKRNAECKHSCVCLQENCLSGVQISSLNFAALLLFCMSLQPDSSETSSVARVQEVIITQLPQHAGAQQPPSAVPGNLAENLDIIPSKVPFFFFF